jgi:hypothetical protein
MALAPLALAAAILCGCGSEKPAGTSPSGGAARQENAAPATPQPSSAVSNDAKGAESSLLKPGSVAAWQERLGIHLPEGWKVLSVSAADAPSGWKRTAGAAGVRVVLDGRDKEGRTVQTSLCFMPGDWEGDCIGEPGKGVTFRAGRCIPPKELGEVKGDFPIPMPSAHLGSNSFGHLFAPSGVDSIRWIQAWEEISWALEVQAPPIFGEPVGGLRLGLFPARATLREKETDLRVRLWYMNVGKEPVEIPVHNAPQINAYRLMFAGEKDGKVFYVAASVARRKVLPPGPKTLQPGERFSEEILLSVPRAKEIVATLKPLALLPLNPGESLTLRAGVCPRIDPRGEKEWNDPATLKSGTILIVRLAAAEALKKTRGEEAGK